MFFWENLFVLCGWIFGNEFSFIYDSFVDYVKCVVFGDKFNWFIDGFSLCCFRFIF